MTEASQTAADAVLEALPLPLLLFGPDRRLRFANAAFIAFSGVGREQLRPGCPLEDCARLLAYRGLLGPGDPERVAAEAAATDRSRPSRRLLHALDGRILDVHSAPTPDRGFLAVTVDVTALVSAQGEATRRAQRLSEVVAALATGVAAFGADLRLGVTNPAYGALIGLPPEELREGTPISEVLRQLEVRGEFAALPPEAIERLKERAAGGGPPLFQRRRPTGQVVETRAAKLPDGGLLLEVSDVTARQAAEDDARRRAALLDSILEALPVGVAVYDAGLCAKLVNRAHRAILGDSAIAAGETLPGLLRRRAEAGDFGDAAVERLVADEIAFRSGGPAERIRRLRSGTTYAHRVAPLPDGGHVSVITDITHLAQAEAEAQRLAARLSAMIERVPFGIALFDAGHRLAAVNGAALRLGGFDPARPPLGLHLADIVAMKVAGGEYGPEDEAWALSADRSRPITRRRTRPDGTILDILSLPMPDGGFIVTFQDVTPLVQAEAAASAREALLRSLVDGMPFGVKLFDAAHRLIAYNEAAVRLSGLQPEDLRPGMTAAEVTARQIARGEFAAAPEHEARLATLDRGKPVRYRRARPDGSVLDIAAVPMPGGGFLVTFSDVTPLVRAEAEAKAQAALLRAMIDNTEAGVLRFDREARLVAANAVALRIEGLTEEDIARRIPREEVLRRVAARGGFDGTPGRFEQVASLPAGAARSYRRSAADGTVVDVVARPMPDGGFLVTLNDVTKLVEAEQEASRRAALLQGMMDNAGYGIVLYDRDHRFVAANALGARFTGLSAEDLRPGVPYAELLALQVARGKFPEETRRMLLAVDRSRPHGYRRVTRDGRVLDIESKPMPDGGFVVSFADVTALVRAEEAATQRAGILAAMLDNLRHGIALFDSDSRLVAANALTAAAMGLPPERLTPGRTLAELRQDQIAFGEYPSEEAARAILGARWTGAFMAPDRYVRERPNGRIIEVTTDRTPDGLYVRTYSDVTEDRRIRADLERARSEAEAALRAKSRFLATMTHELRTPLNAVIGFAELLQRPQPAEAVAEFAAQIAQAGRDLLGLIDQILDVARSESGGLPLREVAVPLAPLLSRVAGEAASAAEAAGVSLSVALPDALPVARADADRLAQVLRGLLSNAIKFTPAGGRVTLSAEAGPEAAAIRITDSGIGIPAAALAHVFEPFAQLDSARSRRYPGSGIGLYLARSIAEAMGMRLALDSREGEGTTATLTIPADRLLPDQGTPA